MCHNSFLKDNVLETVKLLACAGLFWVYVMIYKRIKVC